MSFPSSFSDIRRSSVAPDNQRPTAAATMLKIHSLLNPMADNSALLAASGSRSAVPAHIPHRSTPAETPRADTPTQSPAKRQKLVKDAAVFIRGTATGPVNYPPYECSESSLQIPSELSQKIAHYHKLYNIYPSALGDEKISDFARHIPYSSEKKTFLNKTGRDAFDVFQYTFVDPNDPERRFVVMWDYQIGLVRVTPFFKACKHSKTTPAKSIKANPGLGELAHSITGGALAAQGYWMPYACARAICLTFCYPVRRALTPIFGPSFVNECLAPDDPGYCRFKIDPQLVRDAAREIEIRKTGRASRSGSPDDSKIRQEIPRSMPANMIAGKDLRPRKEKKPSFPSSSPFTSDSDTSYNHHYSHKAPAPRSPNLSPKSSNRDVDGASWTSINQRGGSPAPPVAQKGPLSGALLTEPRYSPAISWRDAEPLSPQELKAVNTCAGSSDTAPQRGVSQLSLQEYDDDHPPHPTRSSSGSESDDVDISTSSRSKRKPSTRSAATQRGEQAATKQSKKFTTVDVRAAQWLLILSARDAELAAGRGSICGVKRKAGSM